MDNVQTTMVCPSCGAATLSLFEYNSLMALRLDLGLFTIECPNCKAKISSIQPIPLQLQKEVVRTAAEVNAGMGMYHIPTEDPGDPEHPFEGEGADLSQDDGDPSAGSDDDAQGSGRSAHGGEKG